MGFSFVSWIVMMSIFVLSVRFFSSCIFLVSPLMFICIIVMVFLEFICCRHHHHHHSRSVIDGKGGGKVVRKEALTVSTTSIYNVQHTSYVQYCQV